MAYRYAFSSKIQAYEPLVGVVSAFAVWVGGGEAVKSKIMAHNKERINCFIRVIIAGFGWDFLGVLLDL